MATDTGRFILSPETAQEDRFTPATVEIGDIFTLTLTDDAGGTKAISFTATAATVANVTAGLAAAWTASTDPRIAEITATDMTTYVKLVADTAGRPFSVAATTTDGGGANTQTLTRTATTASLSAYDYGLGGNWSLAAKPASTNDVILPATMGATPIYYSLNQSAVDIASFTVNRGNTGQIGRLEQSQFYYLKIDPDAFAYDGSSSRTMFDLGSWNGSPIITNTGSPSTGYNALYLKGSNLATVNIVGNSNVGIAMLPGDTATAATINVGSPGGTPTVDLSAGATWTTLNHYSGTLNVRSAGTTVTQEGGTLTTSGSGAITTYNAKGGTAYPNSTGTIGTLHIYDGNVDMTRSPLARTVSAVVFHEGTGTLTYDSAVVTVTAITGSGRIRLAASVAA